jgi:hypothetical protein
VTASQTVQRPPVPALTVTLALRACANAAFAWWLVTRVPGWTKIFEAAAVYAFVEGGLAVLMAMQIARHAPLGGSPLLLWITVSDAILLLGAAIVLRVFPGVSGFPITMTLFYAVVGLWAATLGAVAIGVSVIRIERDRHASRTRRLRDHELFDPIAGAGLVAAGFAIYAFVSGPPTDGPSLLRVSTLGASILAAVFVVASIGMLLRHG